jgi:hypothetical protein
VSGADRTVRKMGLRGQGFSLMERVPGGHTETIECTLCSFDYRLVLGWLVAGLFETRIRQDSQTAVHLLKRSPPVLLNPIINFATGFEWPTLSCYSFGGPL